MMLERIYKNKEMLTGKIGNTILVFQKIGLADRRSQWARMWQTRSPGAPNNREYFSWLMHRVARAWRK